MAVKAQWIIDKLEKMAPPEKKVRQEKRVKVERHDACCELV
jgi:hypothetical protein